MVYEPVPLPGPPGIGTLAMPRQLLHELSISAATNTARPRHAACPIRPTATGLHRVVCPPLPVVTLIGPPLSVPQREGGDRRVPSKPAGPLLDRRDPSGLGVATTTKPAQVWGRPDRGSRLDPGRAAGRAADT